MSTDFYDLAHSIQTLVLCSGLIAAIIYCSANWQQAPRAYALASAGLALLLVNYVLGWGYNFLDNLGLLDTGSESATKIYFLASSLVYMLGIALSVLAIFQSRPSAK